MLGSLCRDTNSAVDTVIGTERILVTGATFTNGI